MNPSIIVGTTAVMVGVVVALVMILGTTDNGGVLPPQSTWQVSLPEGTEQTWYVDASDLTTTNLLITTTTEGKITYEEFSGATKQTYTTMNYDTAKAYYESTKGDMDSEVTAVLDEYWATISATTYKGDCVTVENPTVEEAEATLNGFQVTFGPDGQPTSIADSTGNTVADILSITEGIPEGTFGGCGTDEDRRQLAETQRKLGVIEDLWNWLGTNTHYCGAGTEVCSRDCPGFGAASASDYSAEKACRKHDFGKYWTEHSFYNKLECGVDYNVNADTSVASVTGLYASAGVAGAWGCYNWESSQNCWWSYVNCGKGCGYWSRPCSTSWSWDTQYGPWRYDGINWSPPGGMYMTAEKDSYNNPCTNSNSASTCSGHGTCGAGKSAGGACPTDNF